MQMILFTIFIWMPAREYTTGGKGERGGARINGERTGDTPKNKRSKEAREKAGGVEKENS